MNKKRIVLVGKAAAGKDFARKICETVLGMNYAVSYTTRPPRVGEINGKDYHFLTEDEFTKKIETGDWYEWVPFNGWYYGTTNEQFHSTCSVFIMTPKGLAHLAEQDRAESFVLYFDIDESIRKERMMERQGNADSVERRIESDRIDFEGFTNYDLKIDNPDYTTEDIVEVVRKNLAVKLVQTNPN